MDLFAFAGVRPSFSGHQTFPLRHGWLEKAYYAVDSGGQSPFNGDDAISKFGVGKNMVNAIKYWSVATGFITVDENDLKPSEYSEVLIKKGRDPYLENLDSIWKIHYELARNLKNTSVFWLFSCFNENIFDRNLALKRLVDFLKAHNQKLPAEKTLNTDLSVTFLNYCSDSSSNRKEDDIGSPLCDLRLIRKTEDNRYVFNFGDKNSLSNELFLESLVNFWEHESERLGQNINALKLETLLHEPLTPGRIFLLNERDIAKRLEKIEELSDGALIWSETAGIAEVRKTHRYNAEALKNKWLQHHE